MRATNEWDTLTKVIVGIADNAKIPEVDISLRTVNYANEADEKNIPVGRYPDQVIDEANEDLDLFVNFLKEESIDVVRPEATDCGYYNYCPRDSVFVHGDLTLATPMPLKARLDEWRAFEKHLYNPKNISCSQSKDLYNIKCVGDPNTLALNETEPAFDAANAIRANEDVLYLVSNSGNKLGAELLQDELGSSATVHLLQDVYSYMHIDSTVTFLRDGLMLLNPSRIKSVDEMPGPFKNWDVIWCPEPTPIGHYGNYRNSSNWLSMNLLSINPNLVVLEENQEDLRKELAKHNIDCAMMPLRHSVTLGGSFHCATLDLERK